MSSIVLRTKMSLTNLRKHLNRQILCICDAIIFLLLLLPREVVLFIGQCEVFMFPQEREPKTESRPPSELVTRATAHCLTIVWNEI